MFFQASRSCALFLAVLALLLNTGCSSPKELKGRVISSGYSSAEFTNVEDGDPALLSGSGVPGARIEIIRDPKKLNAFAENSSGTAADPHILMVCT